ncbi:MAG: hypothetical protein HY698_21240 [Deltaproteobacteria bacterium]|nr:hypothetical protein [Deltaproteobacteria bacterium]
MYNVTVEASHTYTVSAGGLLVHNKADVNRGYAHAWIKKSLFRDLQRLVGLPDRDKFVAALRKGIVGPVGQSGVKVLEPAVGAFTHELKIGGSAQRLLGRVINGVLVFEEFVRGGLH